MFHWSLVLFFSIAYIVADNYPAIHSYAGYTVFLLVFFRLVWGFIGTPYALFSEFISSPADTISYIKSLFAGESKRHLGHNPAGSMMIVVLLISLTGTAFLGMALFALEGSGPFAGTDISTWSGPQLEELHEFFANSTLFLILLHLAGVIYSSYMHKENLIKAMITGDKMKKPLAASSAATPTSSHTALHTKPSGESNSNCRGKEL